MSEKMIQSKLWGGGALVNKTDRYISARFPCGIKIFDYPGGYGKTFTTDDAALLAEISALLAEAGATAFNEAETVDTEQDTELIDDNRNYWRYRAGYGKPTDYKESIEYNWGLDLKQSVMQHQLEDVGDLRQYSGIAAMKAIRPDNEYGADDVWRLFKDIKQGDIIFSIGSGENRVLGIGIVKDNLYTYDGADGKRFHKRNVIWIDSEHNAVHGSKQKTLLRFDLKRDSSRKTLNDLLFLYQKDYIKLLDELRSHSFSAK